MLGGIGSCGRVLCCSSFLGDFEPVSIRMAKDQKLSLNPTKISGICGRLMCCLKYESGDYDELKRAAQGRERCGKHCQKGDEEVIGLDDDVLKLEEENKPERGPAVPVGGKGRQEGRYKKGEKYKGKSEKV